MLEDDVSDRVSGKEREAAATATGHAASLPALSDHFTLGKLPSHLSDGMCLLKCSAALGCREAGNIRELSFAYSLSKERQKCLPTLFND